MTSERAAPARSPAAHARHPVLRSLRRILLTLFITVASGYALVLALLWWQQDRLVFPGAGQGERPIDVPGARVQELVRDGGAKFRVVELVPERPVALALCFVGNGEDLRSGARHADELAAHGLAALAVEYPGYGGSEGAPGVAALLATAEAAARHADRRARELGVPLVIVGSSLGTFCAVHVAAAGLGERMLLRAPPTTLVAAAKARFWWLPVELLLRHQFDSLSRAAAVQCPVLVLHGDRDGIVPDRLGRQLCEAFAGQAQFVIVPGAGHNNLPLGPGGALGARIGAFLRGS